MQEVEEVFMDTLVKAHPVILEVVLLGEGHLMVVVMLFMLKDDYTLVASDYVIYAIFLTF